METGQLDISLLEEIEAHSVHIAREAGRIVLDYFNKPLEVTFKGEEKKDPVTTADLRSEEYLKTAIAEKYPRHNILSEEGGRINTGDSPFVWVLDPLDGTSNFMNGMPLFAVSIGVLWNGKPVAGSIFVPVGHNAKAGVYHACLGKGAFFDDEKLEVPREIPGRRLAGNPFRLGRPSRFGGKSKREPHEGRNLGSIALEMALTACGVFNFTLFGGPKLWDAAAGALLVSEAGGVVFTRPPKSKTWQPLERFEVAQNNDSEELENLSKWSTPLVVGAPEIAQSVVEDFKVPFKPFSRIFPTRRR